MLSVIRYMIAFCVFIWRIAVYSLKYGFHLWHVFLSNVSLYHESMLFKCNYSKYYIAGFHSYVMQNHYQHTEVQCDKKSS